ncbi:hypothetical protein QA597_07005 [Marinilabiliaceae bacterium ANBcel2]|nr:hypothetical protein [Marinilabiliaceae bacterium ANBcel2]
MKLFTILTLFLFLVPAIVSTQSAQEEKLLKNCGENMSSEFIQSNNSFRAFLTGEEIAEFRTTLLKGNVYRLVLCTHQPQLIEITIYDYERNKIFSNSDFNYTNKWDFKIENSVEFIIEAKLNQDVANSGMALMLLGFKNYL